VNAAIDYGTDIRCPGADADELFSEGTGLDIVRQDALHSITSTEFLGVGGDEAGYDVRSLLGAPPELLPSFGPLIESILTADDRILAASVTITAIRRANRTADATLVANCTTDAGPFTLTIPSIADLTTETLEGQAR
jgi:hypothetical protein